MKTLTIETEQDPVRFLGTEALKQFLIRECREFRDNGEAVKKQWCSFGFCPSNTYNNIFGLFIELKSPTNGRYQFPLFQIRGTRVPKELWMEVRDIVQETSVQDHPQEKEMKKAKWMSEALQIAQKRREAKGKGEKERYTHLNAEFQTIARRDKKAFFSDQCKEIEENNRMGKTRDLFKKIRNTKGTFHAKWTQ